MALPFLLGQSKKRDSIIAIDLGGRSTKAIHMQRRGDVFTLLRYCVLDAPIYEKTLSPEILTEHLKAVHAALETKTKFVSIAVSVQDSIVRQAELPQIPLDDMRQILKNNTKNYLQQDLPGHTFDCHFIPNRTNAGDGGKNGNPASQKLKVLVGGARKQLMDEIQTAVQKAGLVADRVIPGIIGPFNAFELAMPDIFSKEAAALVDIGFKSTSICLIQRGELVVSRVVNIGGDKLTQGLAEAMGISYAEAEGIKIGMPAEVQSNIEPLIAPLGRELRASVDFFEHQQDRTVGQIYVSGASARSDILMKALEIELMAPCKSWTPLANIQLALPPAQMSEVEQIAPQLTVAVGTAATTF